jgi:hypothetical protein
MSAIIKRYDKCKKFPKKRWGTKMCKINNKNTKM